MCAACVAGKFMPGLIEGLIGAKDGDVKEIKVQFPQRSSVPQVAAAPPPPAPFPPASCELGRERAPMPACL